MLALLVAGAVGRAAETLRIVPISADDKVVVSVELSDAYTDEVRRAIASGLRTTFTYTIDLRMLVPGWVDRTVASSTVSLSDQYDNLTRRHTLSRIVDGRVDDTVVTEDDAGRAPVADDAARGCRSFAPRASIPDATTTSASARRRARAAVRCSGSQAPSPARRNSRSSPERSPTHSDPQRQTEIHSTAATPIATCMPTATAANLFHRS